MRGHRGSKWQSQDSVEVCIPAEPRLLTRCHWVCDMQDSVAGAQFWGGVASRLALLVPAYL